MMILINYYTEGSINMALRGIDVSEFNGTVNWDLIKETGVSFAIIRIGIGSDQEDQDDKQANRNMDECQRLGIPYGVYLYSYALCEDQAHSEVNHIFRMIQDRNPQLGVWFDMEDSDGYKSRNNFPSNQHGTELTDFCCIVCDTINDAGYKAGVYANLDFFNNILDSSRLSGYLKWLAHWYYNDTRSNDTNAADKANEGLTMWQYSSWGQVNGSNARTDMNFYYGNLNETPSDPTSTDINVIDAMINSAYKDILHRSPDGDGLKGWEDALLGGMAESTMRDTLLNCPEILAKRQLIRDLYIADLGRPASESEVDGWMIWTNDEITNGIYISDEAVTYRKTLAQIEADKVAEANRIEEEQRAAEAKRIAEIERIKLETQTQLDETLSHLWRGYYTSQKDDKRGLYTLTETHSIDESTMSTQQELDRVAMKAAYDKYNGIILGLN